MKNTHLVRLQQNHMATTFDLRISCEPARVGLAERVLRACHSEIARLERELSEYLPESPVYRLNHSAPGERIAFSSDGIELLEQAARLALRSQRAFDPLAKSAPGCEPGLDWDRTTREAWRDSPATWLGFGAIGKGFALDRARALINEAGFRNYLLSGGGSSIVLSGYETPSRPWHWGWSWKKDGDEDLGLRFTHWSGKAISLGISGTHEKGEHIIATGLPRPLPGASQRASLRSALVATASAAEADALSTALFVCGWEEARSFMAELPSPPATAWIDESETPGWNGLFARLWPSSMEGGWRSAATRAAGGASLLAGLAAFLFLPVIGHADQSIDLSALGGAANSFTPYDFERNPWWVLLPIFCFLLVLSHLRRTKPKRERRKLTEKLMKKKTSAPVSILLAASLAWMVSDCAQAATIEPLGKAVMAILGTPKAFAKNLSGTQVYYSKGADGRADKVAFIEHGTYQPDCTHTWAVGIDAHTATVTQVRVVEMACPHAYPTRSASFLDQFKGKGPADAAKLSSQVHVVAKATGSSQLATKAVKAAITTMEEYKGRF